MATESQITNIDTVLNPIFCSISICTSKRLIDFIKPIKEAKNAK